MTTLHMETEQVRQAAQRLGNIAAQMLTAASALRSTRGRLSVAWQGGRAEGYQQSLRDLIRRYENQLQGLEDLALRVSREVDEWEAADRDRPFGRWHDEKTLFERLNADIGFVRNTATFAATAYLLSRIKAGTTYVGQMKYYGPQWVKKIAGVSPTLTHSGATGLAKNIAKDAHLGPLQWGLAGLEYSDKAVEDWARYEKGSEKTAALAVDASFVAVKTVGTLAFQKLIMGTLGVAALGALATAGAPVVLVAAAGFGIWWGSGALFNLGADSLYKLSDNAGVKDAIVQASGQMIDGAVNVAGSAAKFVDSAFKSAANGISSLFK
ncbi:MAG: WXG100 family type VII secretion target [Anaerolineales bacterium]|nr:WXG100 family type VII secretion target [Anaerolineales bacterium]